MTDNALGWWSVLYYGSVLTDGYSAINHPFANDFWPKNSRAIRASNLFLKNVREEVVGNYDKTGDDNHLYDRYVAEAKLLRATFHFDMSSCLATSLLQVMMKRVYPSFFSRMTHA